MVEEFVAGSPQESNRKRESGLGISLFRGQKHMKFASKVQAYPPTFIQELTADGRHVHNGSDI